nr:MAG TPA: hypothetical protein [Caudoviricetes sp.]
MKTLNKQESLNTLQVDLFKITCNVFIILRR